MAMSHPRCARLFFLHSEPGQDVGARLFRVSPQVRAVPNCTARSVLILTGIVSGAAGHNREEWRRRHSSQGHKAGTLAVLGTVVGCLLSSYGRAARVIEHEQEYPACSQWNTAREGMSATTAHKGSWC